MQIDRVSMREHSEEARVHLGTHRERKTEGDGVCVHVREETGRECQRCMKLMCQMSEGSVRVSSPWGSQSVREPIMLCLDACHCSHIASSCLVTSDSRMTI